MTYEQRFLAFHRANPHVYAELVQLCREARARGNEKLGIRLVSEVARWNLTIMTNDPTSDFKLNDHYHSRYARLIMEQEKDLVGIFELRRLKTT